MELRLHFRVEDGGGNPVSICHDGNAWFFEQKQTDANGQERIAKVWAANAQMKILALWLAMVRDAEQDLINYAHDEKRSNYDVPHRLNISGGPQYAGIGGKGMDELAAGLVIQDMNSEESHPIIGDEAVCISVMNIPERGPVYFDTDQVGFLIGVVEAALREAE